MVKLKLMLPYLFVSAAATFLFPLILLRAEMLGAMLLFFLLLPGVCGICGFLLGKKAGILWSFGPLCCVIFWLSIPVYYNSSALVYGLINAGVALAGCCVGAGFHPEDDEQPSDDQTVL